MHEQTITEIKTYSICVPDETDPPSQEARVVYAAAKTLIQALVREPLAYSCELISARFKGLEFKGIDSRLHPAFCATIRLNKYEEMLIRGEVEKAVERHVSHFTKKVDELYMRPRGYSVIYRGIVNGTTYFSYSKLNESATQ